MREKIHSILEFKPSKKSENLVLLITLSIFFVLLIVHAILQPADEYGADGETYLMLGEQASQSPNMILCNNFHHAYWSPGWIMIIGFLFKIFGPIYLSVRIFLVCCAILSAYLVYQLSKEKFGFMPSLIVTVLFLASTLTFRYTVYYQYEVFLGFLIMLLSFTLIKSLKKDNTLKSVLFSFLAGLVAAYACLTSGKMIILVIIYLILLSIHYKNSFTTKALPAIITVLLLISGWAYRNYNCFEEFMLLTSNGGINLYIGNNPHSSLTYSLPDKEIRPDYQFHESSLWMKEALNYILENPGTTLKRMGQKILLFFNPHYGDQIILTILFVIGLVKFYQYRKRLNIPDYWILSLPFIFWGVHIVFFYAPRFIIPIWPIMALIAASSMRKWKE